MASNFRVVATGVGRTEGPVVRSNGEVLFTSMDQGYLYRMKDGVPEQFAETLGSPNGATEGPDGTIYVAQASGRGSTLTRKALETGGIQAVDGLGNVTWLTTDPIGPNDLCFGPDGLLYFTDPTRGKHGQERRDDGRLFRVDVASGECELLRSLSWYPNGIAFGPDDALYVASTGDSRFVRIPLENGKLGKEETFTTMVSGRPDGFLFDVAGNLVTSALIWGEQQRAQIHTYDRSGEFIDAFEAPDDSHHYTNVALGDDRVLYVTDMQGGRVLALDDRPYAGLPLHPFRTSNVLN